MAISPAEILREQNPDAIPADAPPTASNYRPADMEGIVCAGCAKFVYTGEIEEADGPVPVGYCQQWEANVRGDHVSDAFADPGPPLDENGDEDWEFADGDNRIFAEVQLAGTDAKEESGFVIKEVLRTGEWPVIPTKGGKIKKPLRIVRDGKSSAKDGTIALAELVENFKAGAISNPQIPLSDDEDDHKNITRVNTGYVRDLWIVDENDQSKLVAKMEFTEPEVMGKVLRGTYADVSCGIPWRVTSRGREYGAALEHVAITNRPFIDGLGPFLAASDSVKSDFEVVAFGETPAPHLTADQILASAHEQIKQWVANFNVKDVKDSDYSVAFTEGDDSVFIRNHVSDTAWTVPFEIDGESVSLSEYSNWVVVKEEGENEPPPRSVSALEKARRLREIRLSQRTMTKRAKGDNMSLTREDLDALELSDDARAELQTILDENASLRASTRASEADRRVDELKDLGLAERPGFLKLYRDVKLSDDGGPAVVLLSDSGQEKERLTALEILDRAIEALKGSDQKVHLSDQALVSGNDNPPPADAEGEKPKSDEERIAEAKRELGLDK